MSVVPESPSIVVSVVSHGQGAMVARLLQDMQRHWYLGNVSVVLTCNIPETLSFDPATFTFPVLLLRNDCPKGFGANHNQAFAHGHGDLFLVMNPDIRAGTDPLPALCRELRRDPKIGLVAPAVVNPQGEIEGSARRRITPARLLRRVARRRRAAEYAVAAQPLQPDWVAGSFMLFPARVFARLGGFDERYFMYCEDADLCRRLWRLGYRVTLTPASRVVHAGQHASHSNPRHLVWHVTSLLRYMLTAPRVAHARR